jgi:hypothetical protein
VDEFPWWAEQPEDLLRACFEQSSLFLVLILDFRTIFENRMSRTLDFANPL